MTKALILAACITIVSVSASRADCITVPENPAYCNFDPSWQQNQLYYNQRDAIQQQQDSLDAIQMQQIINNQQQQDDQFYQRSQQLNNGY